jgi:hypothetical protein
MLAEDSFHLVVEERWTVMPILQLHHDVAPELVILSEHRYHRN